MELASYLSLTKTTDADFAEKVGRERSTVTRWRLKRTRPDWDAMMRIEEITDGAVTARDFMTARQTPEAAE